MRTMIAGTSVMDAALLVISAEEKRPQPQTVEHLAAIEAFGLKNVVVVQNKIECVGEEAARKHATQVRRFLKGTVAEDAPIIPVSAWMGINVDAVLDLLANVEIPDRDTTSPPRMAVVQSFDVKKLSTGIEDVKGGVAGGTLTRGALRLHDEIEIRPGLFLRNETTRALTWKPLLSRITSLSAETQILEYATPGDLIGVGTNLDPLLCGADRIVGQVLGLRGTLPPVFTSLTIRFKLLSHFEENNEVRCKGTLRRDEAIMLNIGSAAIEGQVVTVKGHKMAVKLNSLACVEVGEKLALSRKLCGYWRLAGLGSVVDGVEAECNVE
jgi:translation initiation factor 2 subunit 3